MGQLSKPQVTTNQFIFQYIYIYIFCCWRDVPKSDENIVVNPLLVKTTCDTLLRLTPHQWQ